MEVYSWHSSAVVPSARRAFSAPILYESHVRLSSGKAEVKVWTSNSVRRRVTQTEESEWKRCVYISIKSIRASSATVPKTKIHNH
jgi:hypothetical protein